MRSNALLLAAMAIATLAGRSMVTPAAAQLRPAARVWVENDREYFRHGDRLRVNFRTSADSYVAVIHIDPDGRLDFVYPHSAWDNEFVRGGRVHSIDRTGWGNGLLVRGGSGIGYLYVIASPVPLDFSRFRAGRSSPWDWSYAGQSVYGDPFWAMEQITRSLLPGWGNVPFVADYFTYFVGGAHHRYPSYACTRPGFTSGWGWGYNASWRSYYGACDRLDLFLRDNPYYFDSRRFRGDRRSYYRDYRDERDWDPRHVFKTDPDIPASRAGDRAGNQPSGGTQRVTPRPGATTTPATRPAQRATPSAERPATAAPTREAAPRPSARPAPVSSERQGGRQAPQRAQPAPAPRPEARPRAPEPQRARPEPSPRPETRARPVERSDAGSRRAEPAATRSSSSGNSERGQATSTPRSRRDN